MIIQWKEEFRTRIPVIDGQHNNLVDLINKLDEKKGKFVDHTFTYEVFAKLIEYTKVHFAFEEKMLLKHNYPKLEQHKKDHKTFINKLSHFLESSKKENFDVTKDILEFLREWFVEHIIKNDLEYANFLRGKNI